MKAAQSNLFLLIDARQIAARTSHFYYVISVKFGATDPHLPLFNRRDFRDKERKDGYTCSLSPFG
jgi:hypothetical protein